MHAAQWIGPGCMQMIRYYSRVEKLAPYQALELQLYRTASLFVMDMLRAQVGR